ncbi:MAG: prevent-host-death protein [Firmicutes bacterium HGW-Firmicutes-1]|jgi:prevent-host-death family protein|nr:MAG: prevent-host-death protein [Firmicutes bacterium HGW-Firmicutes-1]
MRVSTTDIQNSFGKYLAQAIAEEDIIITKNGKGVAKLVAFEDEQSGMIKEQGLNYKKERKVTYEEYLEIVENTDERYELIDGEIYYMASPLFKHQVAVNEIFGHFYNWFKGKPCRPLTSPFDVKLFNNAKRFEDDPNVVQPDILVMCDEEKVTTEGKYEGTPTLVVEVLSKSTRSKDMVKKMNLFMNSNIKEYWLVDTEKELTYVYYFEERDIRDSWVYLKDMTIKSEIFKGLEINVSDIFTW